MVELRPGDHVRADWITLHGGAPCMEQHGDGACIALDPATRLCTIYATRPQTCRDFARGSALCYAALARVGAKGKPGA